MKEIGPAVLSDASRRSARRLRPRTFDRRYELLASLDPHFAATWATYVGELFSRPGLDFRTRLVVLAGQYTVMRNPSGLEDVVIAAINEDIPLREILESIFLTLVYGGDGPMLEAVEIFSSVVSNNGLLSTLASRGLPPEAGTAEYRSLEDERRLWAREDIADPRTSRFLERYGWEALSTGLRLRPRAQLDTLTRLDAIDRDFADLWLTTIYGRIYSRGVLDDRTRLLCMIGDCMAMSEGKQLARHLRNALRHGATVEEVLEVLFQSCVVVGHPSALGLAVDGFIEILDSEGLLEEIAAERIEELREAMSRR